MPKNVAQEQPPDGIVKKFFISRAGPDGSVALAVKAILKAAGHQALTQEDFTGSFIEGMHAALGRDFYVVALLSGAYLKSPHCTAEWQQPLASDPLNVRGRLVIFRLEQVEPEGLLAPLIYNDLSTILCEPDQLRDAVLRAVSTTAHAVGTETAQLPGKALGKRVSYPGPIRDAILVAIGLLNDGEWAKARDGFLEVLKTAEAAKLDVACIDIKCSLALLAVRADKDTQRAERLLAECMDALSRTGSDPLRADVLSVLAVLQEALGDLERAAALQRQELAIRHRLPNKVNEAGTLLHLAWTVGRNGDTTEAMNLNKRAYELLVEGGLGERDDDERFHDQTLMAHVFYQRAKICQRDADPDGVFRALSQALEWQRKNPANHELAKILREMGELRLFRRELNQGLEFLAEAAGIYRDRELWLELSNCLKTMGRIYASADERAHAKKLFEEAVELALVSSDPGSAATILQDLAQLASEEGDAEAARAYLQNATEVSSDAEIQAESLMRLATMAERDGDTVERERLICQAVTVIRTDLERADMSALERADKQFTLGYYLREINRLEEALDAVERAKRSFDSAGVISEFARAAFESAGILDHLKRSTEARRVCEDLRARLASTPLFEIRAAVELSLARFAEKDGNMGEAETMAERALTWCREHELPLMSDALLLLEQLRAKRRARSIGKAALEDLIGQYRSEWLMCPANKDGFTRYWVFSHWVDISNAFRSAIGPNLLVVSDTLDWFIEVSKRLQVYRDWSLLVTTEKYPGTIMETIPFVGDMKVSPDAVIFVGRRKKPADGLDADSEDARLTTLQMDYEARTRIGLARYARGGGEIARYQFVSLENQSEEFGGAAHGVFGPSLALPPSVMELLSLQNDEVRERFRLFFAACDRDQIDPDEVLWHDLMVSNDYRLIPTYRGKLPASTRVSPLGRCRIALPMFSGGIDEAARRAIRQLRQALATMSGEDKHRARLALSDLEAAAEELVSLAPDMAAVRLECVLLSFQRDDAELTQPALVISE